jgi:tryptophan-rich sensory protein
MNVLDSISEVRSPAEVVSISEIICPEEDYMEKYDHVKHAVPPTSFTDPLIFFTGTVIEDSAEMAIQRISKKEIWLIYISITIINILIVASSVNGSFSNWYQNLKKSFNNNINILISVLWLVSSVLAYGAIFMIWEHVKPDQISKDIIVSIYFLIGTFLGLAWSATFFQGNDLYSSFWMSLIVFIYYIWLLIHVWYMNPFAGLFLIPLVAMYGFLMYEMIHIASLNNIPM